LPARPNSPLPTFPTILENSFPTTKTGRGEGLLSRRKQWNLRANRSVIESDLGEENVPFCDAARLVKKFTLRIAQLSAMMAATLALTAALGIASAAESTLVRTTDGWVQGKTVGSVDQWLGVRYAASPAGVNRWTPPKDPGFYGARQNPYNATQFGAPCPQNISQFGNSIPLPIPPDTVPVPGSADSEDCLFLNVYVPADRSDDDGLPLPVLIWIHGGSNQFG